MRNILFVSIILLLSFSCNSNNSEKVKIISEKWVSENVLPLFKNASIINSSDCKKETYSRESTGKTQENVRNNVLAIVNSTYRPSSYDNTLSVAESYEKGLDKLLLFEESKYYYICQIEIKHNDGEDRKLIVNIVLDENFNVLNEL